MAVQKIALSHHHYDFDGQDQFYEQNLTYHHDLNGDGRPETIVVHESTKFDMKVDWSEIFNNHFGSGQPGVYPWYRRSTIVIEVTDSQSGKTNRLEKKSERILTHQEMNVTRGGPLLMLQGGALEYVQGKSGYSGFRFATQEPGRYANFEYPFAIKK